jgi:hypothetical protein
MGFNGSIKRYSFALEIILGTGQTDIVRAAGAFPHKLVVLHAKRTIILEGHGLISVGRIRYAQFVL